LLDIEISILEHSGYRVLTATTGGLAEVHACEYTGQIGLLLADEIMPDMNERELSEKLTALSS